MASEETPSPSSQARSESPSPSPQARARAPERPRLRPVEVKPAQHEGEQVYVLVDPLKLADRPAILHMAGLALTELLDGSRTIPEVAVEFTTRFGIRVEHDQVEALVRQLDEALLLEGGRFVASVDAWRASPVREAAHAGDNGSYPARPTELARFLAAHYGRPGGPGTAPAGASRRGPIRGVVSPHIDFHRGGHAYAHAWKAVAEECAADVFVVFGTAHAGTGPARFALTRKDYATPLGTIPVDHELLERVLAHYDGPDDLFAGEIAHKGEHSIEFQMVELAHVFGERSDKPRPIRALPVLCGSLRDLNGGPRGQGRKAPPQAPSEDPRVRAFHQALAKALEPIAPERVCFVAGVDLAHVGKLFDEPPLTPAQLDAVLRKDKRTLRIVTETRDPDAFHADVASDGDARQICGHSAIAATLEALRRSPGRHEGELLTHDRWYDGESSVTFASAVFRSGAR